jgi:hypothetical protein
MSDYEHESVEDREDAEALARAETFILEVARAHEPRSLSELRESLDEAEPPEQVDGALLRAALWALLNENRLELTPDRALRVTG